MSRPIPEVPKSNFNGSIQALCSIYGKIKRGYVCSPSPLLFDKGDFQPENSKERAEVFHRERAALEFIVQSCLVQSCLCRQFLEGYPLLFRYGFQFVFHVHLLHLLNFLLTTRVFTIYYYRKTRVYTNFLLS